MTKVEAILDEARELSREDRAFLVEQLNRTLDEDDWEPDDELAAEVIKREAEIRAGRMKLYSWDEARLLIAAGKGSGKSETINRKSAIENRQSQAWAAELDRRSQFAREHPETLVDWEEVEAELFGERHDSPG